MEVIASLDKRARLADERPRLVVDMCRGKKVSEAQAIMRFMPNKTAFDVEQATEVGCRERREQLRPRSGRSLDQGHLCRRRTVDAPIQAPRPEVASAESSGGPARSRSSPRIRGDR